ncbi:hypothetical protein [Lacrimispora sp.]|uniref:hypothetical protein n=1 Tax=Lacrimispora sp. TaxID=2719234 RepID=UPI003994FA01
MKKFPVLLLAAATALTVAGVPMTAQAATCSRSYSNGYTSNCFRQSGNLNNLLNCNGYKSSCVKGNNNSKSSCFNGKTTYTVNSRQCNSLSSFWR